MKNFPIDVWLSFNPRNNDCKWFNSEEEALEWWGEPDSANWNWTKPQFFTSDY